MTPDERRQLARTLAAIDRAASADRSQAHRRRRFGLLFMTACCLALAAWIAILILTLPMRYTSHDWRGVWVGLDLAELVGFAATAWAAWHQRQILIFLMIVTGIAAGLRRLVRPRARLRLPRLHHEPRHRPGRRAAASRAAVHQRQAAGKGHHPGHDAAERDRLPGATAVADPAVRARPGGGAARPPQAAERAAAGACHVRCHSSRGPLVFRNQTISRDRAIPRGETWTRASTPNTAR